MTNKDPYYVVIDKIFFYKKRSEGSKVNDTPEYFIFKNLILYKSDNLNLVIKEAEKLVKSKFMGYRKEKTILKEADIDNLFVILKVVDIDNQKAGPIKNYSLDTKFIKKMLLLI